jgi:prefoldin subunit 5
MFLFEWLLEVFRELRRIYLDNLASGGPSRRMWRQLRIMYGRGEIDRPTFFRLRSNLEKGYYIEGDLQMYHRRAEARLVTEGKYLVGHTDPEIAHSLDNLYLNRAVLEEVRLEMKQALRVMASTQEWIQQQAGTIQENAQRALPNEADARAFLEIRQDLLERIQYLKSRSNAVQQNMRQIDMLEAELGMYEAELMLLESQEHYAAVKLALHR